jgi:hypothetical protein
MFSSVKTIPTHMPEAFAIIAVAAVVAVAFIGAWMQERNPAQQNAAADLERLRQHASWLEQRMATAERENWGDAMISNLASERAATLQQLAQAQVGQVD